MDLSYNELKEQHTALKTAVETLVRAKDRKDICGKDDTYEILKDAGWRKANFALELCGGKKPDTSENAALNISDVSGSFCGTCEKPVTLYNVKYKKWYCWHCRKYL